MSLGRGNGKYWCLAPEVWPVPDPSWQGLLPRNDGWWLGLRPLPCKYTQAAASSTTSATCTPTISDTRASVLYNIPNNKWSL
jgi:hypothetical protein